MPARIVQGPEGEAEAVEILRHGGLVALPTETVYGLAARALDARACAAIFEAKSRPLSDPLIVHLPSLEWLDRLALPSPPLRAAAERFWPGPLTIVAPAKKEIPEIVRAGQPTVALRWSAHPVLARVLEGLGEPVAAPSANRFGRISPTSAQDVMEELGGVISLILDAGRCEHGIESTIVYEDRGVFHVLRKGPVTLADLEAVAPVAATRHGGPAAPGALPSHYAPRTPLVLEPDPRPRRSRCGLLAWAGRSAEGFAACERLSASGDPREAAANLYSAMRKLDRLGLDLIVAEQPPPTGGLAEAIAERLAKAAGPRAPFTSPAYRLPCDEGWKPLWQGARPTPQPRQECQVPAPHDPASGKRERGWGD